MIVVVPPKAAARVPVSNVSLANVPPKGSSMWVWTSMAPGITYLPAASMVSLGQRGAFEAAADRLDRLSVDQDVGLRRAVGVDDRAARDQRAHPSLLRSGEDILPMRGLEAWLAGAGS